MNGQTDGQTDRQTIRFLDAPADLSGRGHKKKKNYYEKIKDCKSGNRTRDP